MCGPGRGVGFVLGGMPAAARPWLWGCGGGRVWMWYGKPLVLLWFCCAVWCGGSGVVLVSWSRLAACVSGLGVGGGMLSGSGAARGCVWSGSGCLLGCGCLLLWWGPGPGGWCGRVGCELYSGREHRMRCCPHPPPLFSCSPRFCLLWGCGGWCGGVLFLWCFLVCVVLFF